MFVSSRLLNIFLLVVVYKVLEFAEYGSLRQSSEHESVERLCRFTIQAATALEHLEKKKVIHPSIRSFNCLVVTDYQVSVAGELFCTVHWRNFVA